MMFGFWSHSGWTQENIALGTWSLHLSFNNLNALAVAPDRVYAANEIGIMVLDKDEKSATTISKIDGLNGSSITTLAYAVAHNILLIGHESGLLSIVKGNEISSINSLVVSSAISGSRKINHIIVNGNFAYVSTDFGLAVFNLENNEVRETYRDLSDVGEVLKINQGAVLADSIFLATEKGVIAGSLTGSNLLDFRNWKRYDQGIFDNNIQSITVHEGELFTAINMSGVYVLQNGTWSLQGFLQNENFKQLYSSFSNLAITTSDKVWIYDGLSASEIGVGETKDPDVAMLDDDGSIWVADGSRGLLSINGGVTGFKPNGPSSNTGWRIDHSILGIVFVKGGFTNGLQPLDKMLPVDLFANGVWSVLPASPQKDITDFDRIGTANFYSSATFGLERSTPEETLIFDDNNSPLTKINPPDLYVPVPSIETSSDGLWVANYGGVMPLHLLTNDLTWHSYSFTQPQAKYPVELLVDKLSQTWMVIDPFKGGGIVVFDKNSGSTTYLSAQAGKGGLPSSNVRSIANDRDGQVWVGTDAGVVFFQNQGNIFNPSIDAVKPIFENRFLLRDETITTIAVDGGNRKWIGTNNGVWLFGPSGEELIQNFTVENSPLLSDQLIDITIDPRTGEVFFLTSKGLVSFRSDATQSDFQFSSVKIFPNPVSAEFNGPVAINGLYRDAVVKITDISGRMVWQTRANGGTATWNARQLNGNRVSTGMYLVFATSEDGTERHVGKIAVIE